MLEKYLEAFADVQYIVVNAQGSTGTCGGIRTALDLIPNESSFMLIWSDLILPEDFAIPNETKNYIGISKDFECRWSYEQDIFREEKSAEHGVAGFFIFKDKSAIINVPAEGEFVRWLQEEKIKFCELSLQKTKEYGIISEYNKLEESRCRPFNKIYVKDEQSI